MAKTLTARFCEGVQPITGKQMAYPDSEVKGLELRVSPEGRKVWSFRYRNQDGSQKRLTLGVFSPTLPDNPEPLAPSVLDLRAARIAARRVRADVDAGKDPATTKRLAKAKAQAEPIRTFDDLADAFLKASQEGRWMPRNKRKRMSTIAGETRSLRLHIRPAIGKIRVEDVDRRTVRRMLEAMRDKGIGAQTAKAHAVTRQVFAYGIDLERVALNPATGFKAPVAPKAKTRTLDDTELKAFWGALIDPSGLRVPPKREGDNGAPVQVSEAMRKALILVALLLNRRSEIAGMALSELDLKNAIWLIPGERMKGGVEHVVPLPPLAVETIKDALKIAKAGREEAPAYVFPSPRDPNKPIRPDSITHAMAELIAALGVPPASPHDLRRTGSTALTSERIGVSPFIRSKVLGHASDTGGGSAVSAAHYDRNSYLTEKRRALAAWESLVLEIVDDQIRGPNVTTIRSGAA